MLCVAALGAPTQTGGEQKTAAVKTKMTRLRESFSVSRQDFVRRGALG